MGTSTPTAPFPGIGATTRIDGARMASARSFARFANWRTFTPGAGSISYCVTVGPLVRPVSTPSTLKVRSESMSFAPMASSWARPASRLRSGAFVRRVGLGSSSGSRSEAREVAGAVRGLDAVARGTAVAGEWDSSSPSPSASPSASPFSFFPRPGLSVATGAGSASSLLTTSASGFAVSPISPRSTSGISFASGSSDSALVSAAGSAALTGGFVPTATIARSGFHPRVTAVSTLTAMTMRNQAPPRPRASAR